MKGKVNRMSWKDGWHEDGKLDYYIENGCFVRGVYNGNTVYPYVRCSTGGFNNVSGIKACKRNFDRISWM